MRVRMQGRGQHHGPGSGADRRRALQLRQGGEAEHPGNVGPRVRDRRHPGRSEISDLRSFSALKKFKIIYMVVQLDLTQEIEVFYVLFERSFSIFRITSL